MDRSFYEENRKSLYASMTPGSALVLFSGHAPRKTADEMYPFFADRSFVYFTGIEQENTVFLAVKDDLQVAETIYLLPPDAHAERWTGARLKPEQAEEISGIRYFGDVTKFPEAMRRLAVSGDIHTVYLDFDQLTSDEPPRDALKLAHRIKEEFPYFTIKNIHSRIRSLRSIKKPCEIEAMKKAQLITRDGIQAMMRASRPGMYEYQYKAEWDYALAQHGVLAPAFPSIISAGQNNFFIHYYAYRGQAMDGDMILNDVGAIWDNECNDVSRGWPCNGKFNDRQRALYECAYQTSEYMFSILKPGITMRDVDRIAHEYCAELLTDIGVIDKPENVREVMWHGGAHHVGLDVHDVCDYAGVTKPGYVFCVDIGIYYEEWGIGFRLEDNCLITKDGCENLSAPTPRSIEDIEAFMGRR